MNMAIVAVSILLNFLFGGYVYAQNRKNATNAVFFILSSVISIWLGIFYLSLVPFNPNVNLALVRLSLFFAIFMTLSFYFLAWTVPQEKFVMKRLHLLVVILATCLAAIVALSPLSFASVSFVNGFPTPMPGPGLAVFGVYVFIGSIATLWILGKKILARSGDQRRQLVSILAGFLLLYILLIGTVFLPVSLYQNTMFVPVSPFYTLLFLLLTGIAILKYHLFNVRIVATEILVTILVVLLLFEGLTSGSMREVLFKLFMAIVVGSLGIAVVRSVYREIKQREEVTHLAESLEKANLRLQEIDQQKTEFLSIASHQLRTPLSILKGYIELIKDGAYGKPTKKLVATLDDMDESNERLVKLVDEFLDISRIEQGRTKFSFGEHSPREVIDSVVKEIADRAKDKGLEIIWKPTDVGTASFDDEKIRHVVFNFMDNAIKYSDKGDITVLLQKDKGGVAVRVRDQGLGFNKPDEANFYQKFYRGENVKNINVTGTGLGLYVCRKFIEAHRGYVWAKSSGLGKGSEFGFWIPEKNSGNGTLSA